MKFIFWAIAACLFFCNDLLGKESANQNAVGEINPKDETIKDSLEYDLMIVGGFFKLDGKYFSDGTQAMPYSNMNHGLGLSLFVPNEIFPNSVKASLYLDGKYMIFEESIDKKISAKKFLDLDYGLQLSSVMGDSFSIGLTLGVSTYQTLVRRSPSDFVMVAYPAPLLGTKFMYSYPIDQSWSVDCYLRQFFIGKALVSGLKIRDGQGYSFGFQFNLEMPDIGYAFLGFQGINDSQNTEEASIDRMEDLVYFGISGELGGTENDIPAF